jgi:UDP-glucose 4-epimerase
MKFLITGGCGFIGSHLAERLLHDGHRVLVIDDLSTGRFANVEHLDGDPKFEVQIGSILDESLTAPAIQNCDAVFHLASAVGVKLIMEQPVRTIETIFQGTDIVLKYANRYRRPTLITSTSEVYGKSADIPFREDGDRLEGPTNVHRWAYACAKSLDEFLALAHWKESRFPVVVTRLFNTVGPRQTGQYGMVIPNFVNRALAGEPIVIHGDGKQCRCFGHVNDVVEGLVGLASASECYGEVVNLGTKEEVSILELANRIKEATNSKSKIEFVDYHAIYGDGFEEMQRRVPSIAKAKRLIGWSPNLSLDRIIADVVEDSKSR